MNRVWTEEELDILRRDRAAKVPVPVTAAKLGRPVPATYARARLIGTLVQPHQSWDETSVARLRELVSADPPMTDKRIAAELNRNVTQIRWKMQDLGLIGVRDLSKLAKVTASETSRLKVAQPAGVRPPAQKRPPRSQASQPASRAIEPPAPIALAASTQVADPAPMDPRATLEYAVKALESIMAERLKTSIAAAEAGMIQAARAAIAEKARIDQRLVVRVKRSSEAEMRRMAQAREAAAQVEKVEDEAKRAEARHKAAEHKHRADEDKAKREKVQSGLSKPTVKKAVLSAVRGTSQDATRPAPQPAPPPAPKILVTETPVAARPATEPDPSAAQVSGRGGWKSVRRDPARILAQAKAKAKPANRADAIDLAQAAQAAIERFIAERGVTKTEADGIQSVVSRLQARGYIVVRDDKGWTIDQRHRIDSESELVAFAEARGIAFSAAA
jgi:hypothetical protein